jgi:NAD-dependent SIR2 family protein deacetylase
MPAPSSPPVQRGGPAPVQLGELDWLDEFVAAAGPGGLAVLTGAGISTESGIPDYRGPNGSLARHTPMTHDEFVTDGEARRRYWARSHVGWRAMRQARPNAGHRALAALEAAGPLSGLVTQNVDGLHGDAGSRRVIELHGNLGRVRCRDCGRISPRRELEDRLRLANPGFQAQVSEVNPDGDAELDERDVERFVVVPCRDCAGVLQPDVVFFGAVVPPERTDATSRLLDGSRALLVLGTSLAVMSAYRLVLRADKRGIPIAIVNAGPTRGAERAALTVDAQLGDVLPALAERFRR